ncbi:LutC/YkgG family protein [Methyloferula stellata]|uniref:LutC/YkgG family protein n=1 Tax=Methyloferula stellata TaxID=876270 RepID=UPI00037BA22B|nr:lactate utilization protein [Methyloferula stellata]
MTSRDIILERVRRALHRDGVSPDSVTAIAESLLLEPELGRPPMPDGDLRSLFASRVTLPQIGATVCVVKDFREVPAAVRAYLAEHGAEGPVALQQDQDLMRLDWGGLTFTSTISPDQMVAIQKALWGIAETGTLVFHSAPNCATLFSFLPLHHIVILEAKRIVAYLEDYAIEAGHMAVPRNANLITGPSGTTDIEGSLVRGAHGPGFLHIIIVDERD